MQTLLAKIDENQHLINSSKVLNVDLLKKINYQFRLDWNFHSNALEGNTLTKDETRSVMINNITVSGKPLKDLLEIRGHDDVITEILHIGKGQKRLSETRIRDIHRAIMHEDDPKQREKIGKWKTEFNCLYNYKGEKIEFTPPNEVREAMHTLLNWYGANLEKIAAQKHDAMHPVLLAFELHLNFVTIHPFYDGNGRTARILMNLILISFGYPPAIIRQEEREIYNRYLADVQVYGGSPDLFFKFMGECLLRSQNFILSKINLNYDEYA